MYLLAIFIFIKILQTFSEDPQPRQYQVVAVRETTEPLLSNTTLCDFNYNPGIFTYQNATFLVVRCENDGIYNQV